MREKAKDLAKGKWPQLLVQLGIADERQLDGKPHPCPSTGEGVDRFRFSDRNGSGNYFCHCSLKGLGGGMALIKCCKGWGYAEACREVEKLVGKIEPGTIKPGPDYDKARSRLQRIEKHSKPAGAAVTTYLRNRGLSPLPTIRQARETYWLDRVSLGTFDAMVCRVITPEGLPASLHVTYLQDGRKAGLDNPRKLMPPCRPTKGGAIRLMPAGPVLGVAEGIETALSAAALFNVPTWSCLNTTLLDQFEPPPGTVELVVFADNDANSAGQRAAYSLAERIARAGIKTRVEIPPVVGQDFNDVLLLQLEKAA